MALGLERVLLLSITLWARLTQDKSHVYIPVAKSVQQKGLVWGWQSGGTEAAAIFPPGRLLLLNTI